MVVGIIILLANSNLIHGLQKQEVSKLTEATVAVVVVEFIDIPGNNVELGGPHFKTTGHSSLLLISIDSLISFALELSTAIAESVALVIRTLPIFPPDGNNTTAYLHSLLEQMSQSQRENENALISVVPAVLEKVHCGPTVVAWTWPLHSLNN